MNCESTSGCLLGFMIYTGAATNYGTGNTLNLLKDFDSYKSPSNVVLHFLEKCIRPGDSDTRQLLQFARTGRNYFAGTSRLLWYPSPKR